MLAPRGPWLHRLTRTIRTPRPVRVPSQGPDASISTITVNARGPRLAIPPFQPQGVRFVASSKTIWTDAVHPVLLPPVVFVGLVLALWSWKCMMMVIFQSKIIYMPGVPPFARSERLEDYTGLCKPVTWRLETIKSLDGTKLAVCHGSIGDDGSFKSGQQKPLTKNVVICYFQGNGGSLPPRLPMLSRILKLLAVQHGNTDIRYQLFALSYRGYWTSSGRPSQPGIEMDAQALLRYVRDQFSRPKSDVELVLWGQSIGSGVATSLAALSASEDTNALRISGLIMETPFTSIKSMLAALYPQKWLPYRYLWPFLWNHWDSETALRRIASSTKQPSILLLPGSQDEVVPPAEAEKLEGLCKELHLDYFRKDVDALHNEASTKGAGQMAIVDFITQRQR